MKKRFYPPVFDYVFKRIAFAGAKLLGEQLKRCQDYHSLKQAVSIVICDGVLLAEEAEYYIGKGKR
jgi:hypothetical protein